MKKLFLALLIALFPAIAIATPNNIAVSGSISHGNNFIITGADFGSKSPVAPVWWDDAEGGSGLISPSTEIAHVESYLTGNNKSYTEIRPQASEDPTTGDEYSVRYKSSWVGVSQAHGHSETYITAGHYPLPSPANGIDTITLGISPRSQQNIWVIMFRQYLPTSWHGTFAGNSNWKMIIFDEGIDSDWGLGDGPYRYWSSEGNYPYDENDTDYGMKGNFISDLGGSANFLNFVGNWTQVIAIYDTGNDYFELATLHAGVGVARETCPGCHTSEPIKGFLSVGSYAVYDNTPANGLTREGMKRFFDDIYVDSTYSRVMLGNNATYSSCTILEPQIPTAWSGTSITVTANLGALTGSTAYLFVFDSTNDANATGVLVTLGGSVTMQNVGGNFSTGN